MSNFLIFIQIKGLKKEMLKKAVLLLIFIFACKLSFKAQQTNNNCNNAAELCSDKLMTFSNIGANATLCSNCEDDFNFCFSPENTIWLKFTTNSTGGAVQVNFNNLVFESNPGQSQQLQAALIQTSSPCNGSSYTLIGNCVSNATGNFSINGTGLTPNTTYYLVVGGDKSGSGITTAAACTFNIYLTGSAVFKPTPFISVAPSKSSICKNEIVTYNVTLANCPDSTNFKWYVNGTFVASTPEAFYQTASLNDGDIVTVQTTCYEVCVDTISKNALPIDVTTVLVDAGPDLGNDPTKISRMSGSTNASSYYWTPSIGLADSSMLNTFVFPDYTIIYYLTAIENGCMAYDDMRFNVNNEVVIPNTFSPNGDGQNDKFEILYVDQYTNNVLQIFDRWGQMIYETTAYSYEKAWDGKNKKNEFAEGVYYYHLELRDVNKRIYNGSITIIK